MKDFNLYIIEKLHLNKNLDVDERLKSEDFLFVIAYDKEYDKLFDKYSDALVKAPDEPYGFIIPFKTAAKIKQSLNCKVYLIPDEYEYLEDFEDAWESGIEYTQDLKRYK